MLVELLETSVLVVLTLGTVRVGVIGLETKALENIEAILEVVVCTTIVEAGDIVPAVLKWERSKVFEAVGVILEVVACTTIVETGDFIPAVPLIEWERAEVFEVVDEARFIADGNADCAETRVALLELEAPQDEDRKGEEGKT